MHNTTAVNSANIALHCNLLTVHSSCHKAGCLQHMTSPEFYLQGWFLVVRNPE